MIVRALEGPLPAYHPPLTRTLQRKSERHARQQGQLADGASSTDASERPKRSRIAHFVMNLPDSAITFLDAFRGVLSPQNVGGRDLSGIYGSSDLPMVHCHCFTRELELERAEQDIRQVRDLRNNVFLRHEALSQMHVNRGSRSRLGTR